jgi:hypothetical protein
LKLAEIPTPPLAPGEALVRVLLSPINASDLHMVRGRYGYQPELPASPGIEGAGIVEAPGPGVQGPMVGTRVVFVDAWNAWREQETTLPQLQGLVKSPARCHRSFTADRVRCLQPRYRKCAAAHLRYYVRKEDMCSGCPKSPVVNGHACVDSA